MEGRRVSIVYARFQRPGCESCAGEAGLLAGAVDRRPTRGSGLHGGAGWTVGNLAAHAPARCFGRCEDLRHAPGVTRLAAIGRSLEHTALDFAGSTAGVPA